MDRICLIAALLVGAACTDVDIFLPKVEPPAPREVKPNALVGSFCTEDPATIVFPLKVWMVIDDSGSMQQNDPNRARYTSMTELATRLGAPGRVFFGGQVFSGQRTQRFSQPRYVDDVTTFNAQVQAVSGAGAGETPYLGALSLALSELNADINENRATAKRTRYVFIFLSDGNPTDSMEPQILAAMDTLMALKGQVGGLTVNTIYLGGGNGTAEQVLRNMALKGEGQFRSFPNGDALDYSGFDFSTIRRSYVQRFFLATNRSMHPTGEGQALDSDGDGLTDALEATLGTNPGNRDSDSDGCSDAMEQRVGWDPRVSGAVNRQCTCRANTATLDSDRDGLSDCEESWIGTLPLDPDSDIGKDTATDGDLVPDGLDFVSLEDATFPNTATDQDLDGFADIDELRRHTSVKLNDTDRERWAYTYPLFKQRASDERCYDFEVGNVTLGKTVASTDHLAGENVIELYFSQSSQDDPHKDRLYRLARLKVPYSEGDQVIRVTPQDFSTVLGVQQ